MTRLTRKEFLKGAVISGAGLVVAACGQAPASPQPGTQDKPGNLLDAKVIAAWGDYYVVAGRVPVSDNIYLAKLHHAKIPSQTNQLGLDDKVVGYLTGIPALTNFLYEVDSVDSVVADKSNTSYSGYGKVMNVMRRTADGENQIGIDVKLHAYDSAFNPMNWGGNQRIIVSESYMQAVFGKSVEEAFSAIDRELSQKMILVNGVNIGTSEDNIHYFLDPKALVVLGPADRISFDDPKALEGLNTIQYSFFNPTYLE